MSRTETVELTTLCLIQRGGEVLLQNRVKKDWQGYTLPGGHIEPGESIVEGTVREIREETGLNIYSPQLCGIKDWCENQCRSVVLFYKATRFDGTLHASDEGEVWWEDLDNLQNLDLSLDMFDMLRVFTEDELSEFFYYQKDGQWLYDLK